MRTLTHIAALTELATSLAEADRDVHENPPALALAAYLGINAQSYQFTRILTWIIAFYYEGVEVIKSSSGLSENNKNTALHNYSVLFQPFLPPFSGNAKVHQWRTASLSATNMAYFELLNDIIIKENPIYLPEMSDVSKYHEDLKAILEEVKQASLPPWIRKDFEESISLTIIAIDKVPFLAHRIIQDAHSTVLARLFSVATPEHRKLMVRVATVMNIVFAAFVMPYEASEAGNSYYSWVVESPPDIKQIEACAQPLALPPPAPKGRKA
jgi:hypothetical protein